MEWWIWAILVISVLTMFLILKKYFGRRDEDIISLAGNRMNKFGDCCRKIFGFGRA